MKKISFFVLHTYVKDAQSAIHYLQLQHLNQSFEFNWNSETPDYLIATEQIYTDQKLFKEFFKLANKAKVLIFFSREAQSPDFNIFDYAVGFDSQLSNYDRFVQLPTAFDLYPAFLTVCENSIKSKEEASIELNKKNRFCNFLYSNPKAHPLRDQLFFKLSEYKKVDSLGRHLNNTTQKGTGYMGHESDCVLIKNPYKFSIASENACFGGYTSEKILTSLAAHTVPIYFGDPFIEDIINPRCFINVNKYKELDDVLARVQEIDNNDELWYEMVSEPWQTPEQVKTSEKRLSNYLKFFENIFSQDPLIAVRRPLGCRPDIYKEFVKNAHIQQKPAILLKMYKYYRRWFS